jgi:8-oxo-dGTP pyrophosphatase MutT (NUDIX family)
MDLLSLRHFEHRLAEHVPAVIDEASVARAAVAAVLRFERGAPDVLLMKRAQRQGDNWSGHVSFPGGREEPGDADLCSTAVRETHEEVGLDLNKRARLIGQLDTIRAVASGRITPLTITPFVFVQTEAAPLTLSHEAVDAFWLPLERALAGELEATYHYKHGGEQRELPGWRYQGHVVWGLTYGMLGHLLDVVTTLGRGSR